ncbi:nitroreductase family protein [Flexithrix dorotheae]|uniref:nitroreductase family protein n=1 Tax=Flexithrix dorotheae TaxID=70993 RepID=UPI0003748A28|nr:nitroreductase [Flexithrix dorotheae]
MSFNTEEVNRLIKSRRSVFVDQFSEQTIDKKIIEQLLENANWAPSHGKTEPWRFFVFSGDGLKKFADFQSGLYKKLTAPENFSEAKFTKLKAKPLKASHIIAVAMKRQESEKIPEIEEVEAVACAVQNIYLTATAYGIGGYWGSGGVTYWEEAKDFFGLGDKDKLLGFFYLGYPKHELAEGKRGDISQKVEWIEE